MGCKGWTPWNRCPHQQVRDRQTGFPSEGLLTRRQRRGGGQQPRAAPARTLPSPIAGVRRVDLRPSPHRWAARTELPQHPLRGSSGLLAPAEPLLLPATSASRHAGAGLGWWDRDGTLGPGNGQPAFQKAHLPGAAAEAWGYRQPQRAPEPLHRIFHGTYPIPRELTTLSSSRREFPVQLIPSKPIHLSAVRHKIRGGGEVLKSILHKH